MINSGYTLNETTAASVMTSVTRCPVFSRDFWLINPCDLWPQATWAAVGREYAPHVNQECCGLRPQQTVAASGGKIPYVFKGIVTKSQLQIADVM